MQPLILSLFFGHEGKCAGRCERQGRTVTSPHQVQGLLPQLTFNTPAWACLLSLPSGYRSYFLCFFFLMQVVLTYMIIVGKSELTKKHKGSQDCSLSHYQAIAPVALPFGFVLFYRCAFYLQDLSLRIQLGCT